MNEKLCPNCGSARIVPIVYGLPESELLEQSQRDEVRLGGCCIDADKPVFSCVDCRHEWGRIGDLIDLKALLQGEPPAES